MADAALVGCRIGFLFVAAPATGVAGQPAAASHDPAVAVTTFGNRPDNRRGCHIADTGRCATVRMEEPVVIVVDRWRDRRCIDHGRASTWLSTTTALGDPMDRDNRCVAGSAGGG